MKLLFTPVTAHDSSLRLEMMREFYEGERLVFDESLAFLQKVCREEGIKAIRLEVVHRNMRTFSLYQGLRFVQHDRYLMTKWL